MQLTVRYTKPWTYVELHVPECRKVVRAKVDNRKVEAMLRRNGLTIGFSLGGIWKAVKKVAKKTGIAKVVKLAKKALPLAAKFLPPPANLAAAGAAAAVGTAEDLIRAAGARKHGNRAKEALHVARAVKRGRAYSAIAGPTARRRALRGGARLYRLVVQPQ